MLREGISRIAAKSEGKCAHSHPQENPGNDLARIKLRQAYHARDANACSAANEGAEFYGLPVSTTHILSSGVAGTMAANGSGLQTGTIRAIVLAWVLTLPAAMLIAGCL